MEEENNATPCPRSSSKVIKDTSESDVRDIGSKGCLPFFGAKALKATLAIHACILISLMHLCYNIRYCNPIQRACPVMNSGTFDIQSDFMCHLLLYNVDSIWVMLYSFASWRLIEWVSILIFFKFFDTLISKYFEYSYFTNNSILVHEKWKGNK